MDKFKRYEKFRTSVCSYGYDVGEYKTIPYGLQFPITFKGNTFTIRIYQSAKKGVTIDYSQVKNHRVQQAFEEMLNGTYVKDGNELYKTDRSDSVLIGTDESGKGDYFGALCVSGVCGDKSVKTKLAKLGVKDCKELDDYEIVQLAKKIKAVEGLTHYTMSLYPEDLNKAVVLKEKNMNTVLGILHLTVINHIVGETNCKLALIDQFANDSLILDLNESKFNIDVEIEQRPKAESNIIVAAASILARNAFLYSINELSNHVSTTLPTGCNDKVIKKGISIVDKHGAGILTEVAKLNFESTTKSIVKDKGILLL